MIIDKYIDDIKSRNLKIKFPEFTLIQQTSDTPIIFRGTGQIHQETDGKFSFICSSTDVKNTDVIKWFNHYLVTSPGKLFPRESYFNLQARDEGGQEWSASGVRADCDWPASGMPTVRGQLRDIVAKEPGTSSDGETCTLHFFDTLELPLWPKHVPAQFETKFAKMSIKRVCEGHFVVTAKSVTKLPISFPLRIVESMRFLTSHEVDAQVVLIKSRDDSQTIFYPRTSITSKSNFPAPLGENSIQFIDEGWKLFSSYLDYVSSTSKPDYWNHVSYHLHNARSSSPVSVDAWAVSVSVAVEGLSHLLDLKSDPAQKILVKEFRNWLMPIVNNNSKFAPLATQFEGLIGMMADVRVKDRLHQLTENGSITKSYVKAWVDLRNKYVHPKEKDLAASSQEKFQNLIDLLYQVTTLMYEIVFYLIDYRGSYSDFGAKEWPIRSRILSNID